MADSTTPISGDSIPNRFEPKSGSELEPPRPAALTQNRGSRELSNAFPSVRYECGADFRIKQASANFKSLLQIEPKSLIGTKAFREERVPAADLEYLAARLNDWKGSGAITIVHRIVNDAGVPLWVAHCLAPVRRRSRARIRGWLVPVSFDWRERVIEHQVVSRFVHKLGNHLQLLTLLSNSLRTQLNESKDLDSLNQAIEKSIELVRALSDYGQQPEEPGEIDIEGLVQSAAAAKEAAFIDKQVIFDVDIGASARGLTVRGDAALLDSAIAGILQNALEATEGGGRVTLTAEAQHGTGEHGPLLRICVSDSGCGIPESDLGNVAAPFFTTKKNHDGLGLSMAKRFIEIHGGAVTVQSRAPQGVDVTILLPAGLAKEAVKP